MRSRAPGASGLQAMGPQATAHVDDPTDLCFVNTVHFQREQELGPVCVAWLLTSGTAPRPPSREQTAGQALGVRSPAAPPALGLPTAQGHCCGRRGHGVCKQLQTGLAHSVLRPPSGTAFQVSSHTGGGSQSVWSVNLPAVWPLSSEPRLPGARWPAPTLATMPTRPPRTGRRR